jgi:hypothetical protein
MPFTPITAAVASWTAASMDIVWMARDCGASIARRVDEDDHASRRLKCTPETPSLCRRAVT